MKRVSIAFDIDGTLRNNKDNNIVANERIRTLLIILSSFKNIDIYCRSGGGDMYALMCAKEMHITEYVKDYKSKSDERRPDIAIDDIQECDMGAINLIVKEK